jgi:probable HAF family extracellular repeat protein
VYSEGLAVSDNGQVVGVASLTEDDPDLFILHAFSWRSGDGIVDLGTLGGTRSSAVALNNNGLVVGSSQLAGDVDEHATLWDTR